MATVIVTKCASIDLGEVRVLGQDVTAAAADYVLTASAEISAASLSLMWKYKDDGTGPEDGTNFTGAVNAKSAVNTVGSRIATILGYTNNALTSGGSDQPAGQGVGNFSTHNSLEGLMVEHVCQDLFFHPQAKAPFVGFYTGTGSGASKTECETLLNTALQNDASGNPLSDIHVIHDITEQLMEAMPNRFNGLNSQDSFQGVPFTAADTFVLYVACTLPSTSHDDPVGGAVTIASGSAFDPLDSTAAGNSNLTLNRTGAGEDGEIIVKCIFNCSA